MSVVYGCGWMKDRDKGVSLLTQSFLFLVLHYAIDVEELLPPPVCFLTVDSFVHFVSKGSIKETTILHILHYRGNEGLPYIYFHIQAVLTQMLFIVTSPGVYLYKSVTYM